jgi:sRNA-binding regulator protein Hfq
MKEKEVMFFTLLEGEMIRGTIADFSRYDITVSLKGARLVTILRHAIYDIRNKGGRSFLRSFQEEHRDWQKCPIYVS